MPTLVPYVVYNGTCRAALEFYRDALGGEITLLQTYAESPIPSPPEHGDRVFNAMFQLGPLLLRASDDMPGHEVAQGTNISLFVNFESAEEKVNAFNKLAVGGKVQFPIEDNFGMLTDQFGVQWMMVHGE